MSAAEVAGTPAKAPPAELAWLGASALAALLCVSGACRACVVSSVIGVGSCIMSAFTGLATMALSSCVDVGAVGLMAAGPGLADAALTADGALALEGGAAADAAVGTEAALVADSATAGSAAAEATLAAEAAAAAEVAPQRTLRVYHKFVCTTLFGYSPARSTFSLRSG